MATNPDDRPGAYGERIAADYDDLHAHVDPGDAVEALARACWSWESAPGG